MKVEIVMTPTITSKVLKHVKDNYYFVVMNPKVHMRKIKEIMKRVKQRIGADNINYEFKRYEEYLNE